MLSIIILVSFQMMVAAPFISDTAAHLLGFKNGAQTSVYRYLQFSKLLGGEEGKQHGAHYDCSIYWTFLDREFYESDSFLLYLKLAIAGVNVFYFFIRHNCLIGCIQ